MTDQLQQGRDAMVEMQKHNARLREAGRLMEPCTKTIRELRKAIKQLRDENARLYHCFDTEEWKKRVEPKSAAELLAEAGVPNMLAGRPINLRVSRPGKGKDNETEKG